MKIKEKIKALPKPVKIIGSIIIVAGLIWAGAIIYKKMSK